VAEYLLDHQWVFDAQAPDKTFIGVLPRISIFGLSIWQRKIKDLKKNDTQSHSSINAAL
jgi:hypothetical protein